jgi:biopolymer transport protein ExbD
MEECMGTLNVESGRGGRRALDSEINMIPMIDLLMVTISFLLITAVWSHMARLNADAQIPSPMVPTTPPSPPSRQLSVEMASPDKFVLVWREGPNVLGSAEIPRREVVSHEGAVRVVRFPELAAKIESQWAVLGAHRSPSDRRFDQAVLHTDNATPYATLVGVMDAISQVKRPLDVGNKVESVSAYNLTFSVN